MNDIIAPNSTLIHLECNVDDMTGEDIGYARELLIEAGAREFYTIPIQMKKGRPGLELHAYCAECDAPALARILLKETSTFGVRQTTMRSYALERDERVIDTEYGRVRVKIGEGYGVRKYKLEYEDLAAYARAANIALGEARKRLSLLAERALN